MSKLTRCGLVLTGFKNLLLFRFLKTDFFSFSTFFKAKKGCEGLCLRVINAIVSAVAPGCVGPFSTGALGSSYKLLQVGVVF